MIFFFCLKKSREEKLGRKESPTLRSCKAGRVAKDKG
nr:MAG TPA: hypothetical protein [Caudoviricetes sp.]